MENLDRIKEELRKMPTETAINESDEDGTKSTYDRIKTILKNPIWNHAAIVEKLWGNKDATNRSLFRKKLKQMNNDSGGTYAFDKEDIAKIYSILMGAASSVTTSEKRAEK